MRKIFLGRRAIENLYKQVDYKLIFRREFVLVELHAAAKHAAACSNLLMVAGSQYYK